MPYGTIKIDTITFTNGGVDKSVPVSGLVQNPTFTGNVTVTGTISGNIIQGGTTVSGLTVTGTTANFASGVFTTQISGVTITGTTVSTTTGNFTSLTGTTATITSGIIASGTAALPSLAILSDPNTGIYSPGADQLAVATNGTEKLIVLSNGNVGIGVSLPAYQLQVNAASDAVLSTSNSSSVTSGSRGSIAHLNSANNTCGMFRFAAVTDNVGTEIQFFTRPAGGSLTQSMTLDSAGRLGIGTTSPAYKLHVSGSTGIIKGESANATFGAPSFSLNDTAHSVEIILTPINGLGAFGTYTNHPLAFYTNNGEKARIDSSGRLLVGTTTDSGPTALVEVAVGAQNAAQFGRYTSSSTPAYVLLTKSRSNTKGAHTIVQNNDGMGVLSFCGSDGTTFLGGAEIKGEIDGTPGANDMPGRLVFSTTADGSASPTERMRISANGNVNVVGALSKGSGSFRIDHPLSEKKDTHHLIHSFIEGPQADLIYRGHVNLINGKAIINIDDAARMAEGTFNALCTNVCCFTSNESDWTAVRGSVSDNILTIEAQDLTSTAEVCWMVIGERKDQHMLDTNWTDENGRVITEPLKEVTPSVTP